MCASGWPITLLLFHLFDSATSSPVSLYTPAPPLPSQISPPSPFPAIISSLQSPSLSIPPSILPFSSNSGETTAKDHCLMTISPSTLVVRFGDPVTANCSVPSINTLAWQVSLAAPDPIMGQFLVWSVDKMTEWNIKPMCCAIPDAEPACHLNLSLIVYKPPDNVSISFSNHTGPMLEGHQYTLHCTVQDVAPIGNVIVTFYRGQTELHRLESNYTEKTPMTEIFILDINPCKDDDGVQYWCEAKLDLGAEGPQPPPVVTSQKLTAEVLYGPNGKKNLTLEVEVVTGSGTANCCNRHFLLAVLLIQIFTCCKTS